MMYSDALAKIRQLEEELVVLREFYAAAYEENPREFQAIEAAQAYYQREDTPDEPV